MDTEQFNTLCAIFLSQTEAINRLATAVETLADNQSHHQGDVSYIRKLADYPSFDWSSIGAEILHRDKDGVAAIAWKGKQYTRRCKPKYGQELWFSCAAGKDEKGENLYHRLICFKDTKAIEVEAIPDSIKQLIPVPKITDKLPKELVYWQQQVRELVKQLNWSEEQAKTWSKRNFDGKISTTQMSVEELKTAFQLLQSLTAVIN